MADLRLAFENFHAANPHVYDTLVFFARQWTATGRTKLGVAMLVERARWDLSIRTESEDEYKIANAHRAFYARLIMWREPDLRGLFNISPSVADDWIAAIIAEDDRRNGESA